MLPAALGEPRVFLGAPGREVRSAPLVDNLGGNGVTSGQEVHT